MPKPQKLQSNFNAGILSPYIEGRPDVAQFYNGMLIGRNIALLPEGGFQKMWGSYYITGVRNNAEAILIAFQPSDDVDFYIEMGVGYFRFFKNGLIIYALSSEMVINGAFNTDITNWTDIDENGGNSFWGSYEGEPCMILVNVGVGTAARTQSITTVIGTQYELTFKVLAGSVKVFIGTTSGSENISTDIYPPGSYTIRFTATATATWITARSDHTGTGATAAYIDDISMGALSGAPYEITSPYTLSDIREIQGGQGLRQINDILFICCSRLQPKELVYAGDTAWVLRNSRFDPMPSAEGQTQINATATLTPGALTGTGVTFTASVASFLAGDDTRIIIFGASRALITSVTDSTHVVADITGDFPNLTPIPAGQWFLSGAPGVALNFPNWGPVGRVMTLTISGVATFRTADVGKFIHMYGGVVEILTFISNEEVTVRIVSELTALKDLEAAGALTAPHTVAIGAWRLESVAWSDQFGWPTLNEFFQGRYVLASNNNQRTTEWLSQSNDFYNFALGALATDALQYTHRSGIFGKLKWLSENGVAMFFGDSWAENSLKGSGVGEALGGDTVPIAKSEARNGSALMRPIHVGNSLLFLDWTTRRVLALSYSFDRDAHIAKISTFATRELPMDVPRGYSPGMSTHAPAYMAQPIPLIFWPRNDGVLLVQSFNDDPEGGNNGWTTLEYDGEIESYCVVRRAKTNVVALLVKRTIADQTVRYIEEIRPEVHDLCEVYWPELQTQSAVILTKLDSAAQTVFTGLDHLEAKSVHALIWKTGQAEWQVPRFLGAFTVTGGAITLDETIDYPCRLEVGLPFVPLVKTMRASVPEAGMDGHLRKWVKYFLRVFRSSLPIVNGTDMQAERSVDTIGQGPFLRSGDFFVDPNDKEDADPKLWDTSLEGYVTITQDKPYPLRVLLTGGEIEVSESMGFSLENEGIIERPDVDDQRGCAVITPDPLALDCLPAVDNPDCLLSAINEVTLEASGGQGPYVFTSPDAVLLVPSGDTVVVSRTGAAGGLYPGDPAYFQPGMRTKGYGSGSTCGGEAYSAASCSLAGEYFDCDGNSLGAFALTWPGFAYTGGGSFLLTLQAPDCTTGVLGTIGTSTSSTVNQSGSGKQTGTTVTIDMEVVSAGNPYNGQAVSLHETITVPNNTFPAFDFVPFDCPLIDIRTTAMIAGGCGGTLPATITVTDALGAQAALVLTS